LLSVPREPKTRVQRHAEELEKAQRAAMLATLCARWTPEQATAALAEVLIANVRINFPKDKDPARYARELDAAITFGELDYATRVLDNAKYKSDAVFTAAGIA